MRKMALLSVVVFLEGCKACAPGLPSQNNNNNNNNPDNPSTPSADGTDGGGDTARLPPCSQPEVEPNNSEAQAQPIDMGPWACGVMDTEGDVEHLSATTAEAGWLRGWVRAADLGSAANVSLTLSAYIPEELETKSARSGRMPGSTDAYLLLPTEAGVTWDVRIDDEDGISGPNHDWEFVLDMAKAPTTCGQWEAEARGTNANNSVEGPEPLETFVICGFIDSTVDQDFFSFEVPDGRTTISAEVLAWNEGSPLNTDLALFNPSNERRALESSGASSQDLDPRLSYNATTGGTWKVRVRDQAGDSDPGTGYFSWYQLTVVLDRGEARDSGADTASGR